MNVNKFKFENCINVHSNCAFVFNERTKQKINFKFVQNFVISLNEKKINENRTVMDPIRSNPKKVYEHKNTNKIIFFKLTIKFINTIGVLSYFERIPMI